MLNAFLKSLEWRAIAFVITTFYFYCLGHTVGEASLLSTGLQFVLFFSHFTWYYFRHAKKEAGGTSAV